MKISRRLFVDPSENEIYGTVAVALSVFVFAYSVLFGAGSILVFYALWLPLILLDYRAVVGPLRNLAAPLALVLLMAASVTWSDAPATTLRATIQYATQIFCASIAARTMPMRTLAHGVMYGCLVVVLYSVLFGHYGYDLMDGSYTFIGAFSSKNQLGNFSSIGLFFCIAILLAPRVSPIAGGVAVFTALLCAYALWASRSATSMLTFGALLAVFLALRVAIRFRPGARITLVILAIPLGFIVMLVALQSNLADQILGVFGKDSTLTGRTYLWSEGLLAFHQKPLLGVGYQAYWVQGFSEAERLWEEFYIGARNGFHFHNTYIEMMVELGVVGLALLVWMILSAILRPLGKIIGGNKDYDLIVLTGFIFLSISRSFFEIDLTFPYTVGSFLFYYAYAHLKLRSYPAKKSAPSTIPVLLGRPISN